LNIGMTGSFMLWSASLATRGCRLPLGPELNVTMETVDSPGACPGRSP